MKETLDEQLVRLNQDTEEFVQKCVLLMNPRPSDAKIRSCTQKIYKFMKTKIKQQYRLVDKRERKAVVPRSDASE